MLFISGNDSNADDAYPHMFQSRNRDAFHFRLTEAHRNAHSHVVSISQSRCFSFQVPDTQVAIHGLPMMFQSRNRDAFHFRSTPRFLPSVRYSRFNLAIEMLFISGNARPIPSAKVISSFQSRNRDAFHFRLLRAGLGVAPAHFSFNLAIEMLFISGEKRLGGKPARCPFQSRNRDAFHFREEITFPYSAARGTVSISQSRCFSFQGQAGLPLRRTSLSVCFNLAIEMLFISGP